jgi:hypothetical protein
MLIDLVGDEVVTLPVACDEARLVEIGGHFLDTKLPPHCIVAGGSVAYACAPASTKYEGMDLDIFTYGPTSHQTSMELIQRLRDQHYIVGYLGNSVATGVKDGVVIQIICTGFATPDEIIYDFDLDYVEAYWFNGECRATPTAMKAWKTVTIRNSRSIAFQSIPKRRYIKAYRKGFDVSKFIELTNVESSSDEYVHEIPTNQAGGAIQVYMRDVLHLRLEHQQLQPMTAGLDGYHSIVNLSNESAQRLLPYITTTAKEHGAFVNMNFSVRTPKLTSPRFHQDLPTGNIYLTRNIKLMAQAGHFYEQLLTIERHLGIHRETWLVLEHYRDIAMKVDGKTEIVNQHGIVISPRPTGILTDMNISCIATGYFVSGGLTWYAKRLIFHASN